MDLFSNISVLRCHKLISIRTACLRSINLGPAIEAAGSDSSNQETAMNVCMTSEVDSVPGPGLFSFAAHKCEVLFMGTILR